MFIRLKEERMIEKEEWREEEEERKPQEIEGGSLIPFSSLFHIILVMYLVWHPQGQIRRVVIIRKSAAPGETGVHF